MKNKYFFNILPVAKPRMTHSDKWNERPPVMRYRAYKEELKLKANLKKFRMGESICITFYLPTKKEFQIRHPHQEKPDLDNLLKAFLDALEAEDKQIWEIKCRKVWSEKPGIEVENI